MFNRNKVAEATFDTAFLTYKLVTLVTIFTFSTDVSFAVNIRSHFAARNDNGKSSVWKCAHLGILRAQKAAVNLVSKSSNVRQI